MRFTLVSCLLFTVSLAVAQKQYVTRLDGSKISPASIDSNVLRLMDNAKVTGLALSILNNNRIAYTKAYGFKNNDKKIALDTATIFCAASLSKAVFAFVTLLLVQEAVLELDKPLYEYLRQPLPQYEKYRDLASDDRWKLITARMCLSHTTGFQNWRFLQARTGMYDTSGKLAIYFTPGKKYSYSGEGLALLQMVIEEMTGKNLELLAQEKLFVPMGLQRTSYIWQERFENNFAYGHTATGEMMGKKKRKKPAGTGSLETSIADYSRFLSYVMQGKGLNKNWKNQMITPQVPIWSKHEFPTISDDSTSDNAGIHLSYGLGWGLLQCKYGKAFFKEGHDDDGWQHYSINFADKGISILIMTNSLNGEKIFKELLEKTIGDTFTPWQWENYIPYDYKQR